MIDHETLRAQLADAATGRLSDEERLLVERHVAVCADCQEVYALAQDVAALGPHPSVIELRDLALGQRHPAVEAHVRACPSCTLEVEAWGRRQPASRRRWVVAASVLLAASLVLAVWVVRQDSGEAQQTLVFAAVTRGPAPPEQVVDPNRSVEIQANWQPLDPFESIGPLVLEIRSAAGAVVWSSARDAASVVETLRAGGNFRSLVPAGTLEPGPHEFGMYRRSRPEEPAVVAGRFAVAATD